MEAAAAAVVETSKPEGARRYASLLICILVPLLFWLAPLPIDAAGKHAIAIALFMVLAWITEAVDHAIAGLIGCFLFWALGIVRFDTAFSGFANDTTWFLFGATLMGAMASKSGLAKRLAYQVMLRVGTTYPRILLGLIVTDFLLTLIVPSGIARIVIMAAVALGLVEAFKLPVGSNGARGIFLIITYTAALFDKMIIAGASSITARGLIEKIGGVDVQWSQWFIAFLPCHILTVLAAWWLTLWLFPPERTELAGGRDYLQGELRKLGSMSSAEFKTALLLGVATLLWVTDFWHHISSAKIGLGIGLAGLLPFIGLLRVDDLRKVNLLPVFFVAAALSMAKVLATTNSLDLLTNAAFGWIAPLMTDNFGAAIVLYWSAFVYHILLSSDIAMLGTSMPLLMTFAKTHGLSPLILGMIWVFGSAGKIFVYQSAVLIVGYSFGYFKSRDLLRLGFLLTLVEFAAILLIVPSYWPLIGVH
jgi:solute carrier family 13 (sodium-dependent dicarboxylate transporter), member 2/3/5